MDEEYLGGTWFLILCILGALLFGWFTVGSLTAGQTPEDFMILGFVGSLAGAVLSRADRLDKDGGEAASDKSSTLRMKHALTCCGLAVPTLNHTGELKLNTW